MDKFKEKMKDILSRLKSPVTLTAVAGGVLAILVNTGVVPASEPYMTTINSIVGILVLVGILNNPTDKDKF